jgi:hypothetical protein
MKRKIPTHTQPWGNLSCSATQHLMNEVRDRSLDPFERNAVFAHCTVCEICRRIQRVQISDALLRISTTK